MSTHPPRIGAVILAGGSVPPTLAQHCTYRALLKLRGRFLLEYLHDTISSIPSVVETVLVVPEETFDALAPLPGRKVASSETFVENMQRGMTALAHIDPTHLLFVTGDIPLVTTAGMEDFLAASLASNAALTYPIIPKQVCETRFPGARRTYVKIRDGVFTGGNLILTRANQLDGIYSLVQRLYSARKNPLQLAGILGWSTMLRMVTHTLTLTYLEGVATGLLGAPVRAIITPHAEIGFDVDKADDLAQVERSLANEAAG